MMHNCAVKKAKIDPGYYTAPRRTPIEERVRVYIGGKNYFKIQNLSVSETPFGLRLKGKANDIKCRNQQQERTVYGRLRTSKHQRQQRRRRHRRS